MPEKEMWDIYQMVNNICMQMDKAETPENKELFEKIRWLIQEMEHKLVTMSNEFSRMNEAFSSFAIAYNSIQEEMTFKYRKPQDS
jgi:hypothetical protein